MKDLHMFELNRGEPYITIPHLGNHPIGEPNRIMPLSLQRVAKYFLEMFPAGTYIGDGKYLPYSSIFDRAYKSEGTKGVLKAMFLKRPLLSTNELNAYSFDSYPLLLSKGTKPGYTVRYSGDYFIPNNDAVRNVIDTTLPLEQLLEQVNNLLIKANPKIPSNRLAIIKDGQIQLPHAWLVKTE